MYLNSEPVLSFKNILTYINTVYAFEPPHDKTNQKMACAPSEDLVQLGIRPVWSEFAVYMKKA